MDDLLLKHLKAMHHCGFHAKSDLEQLKKSELITQLQLYLLLPSEQNNKEGGLTELPFNLGYKTEDYFLSFVSLQSLYAFQTAKAREYLIDNNLLKAVISIDEPSYAILLLVPQCHHLKPAPDNDDNALINFIMLDSLALHNRQKIKQLLHILKFAQAIYIPYEERYSASCYMSEFEEGIPGTVEADYSFMARKKEIIKNKYRLNPSLYVE